MHWTESGRGDGQGDVDYGRSSFVQATGKKKNKKCRPSLLFYVAFIYTRPIQLLFQHRDRLLRVTNTYVSPLYSNDNHPPPRLCRLVLPIMF